MSKVTVPIGMQEDLDLEAAVAYLRKVRCERVFLAQIYRALERDADYFAVLERVRQRMAFFRNAGFEVGIWLPTIGYGGPVLERNRAVSDRLTHIRSITGRVAEDALCPTDGQFVDIICAMLADHAALHPDLLMLDDELCLSVRPGIGCACERHLAEYQRGLVDNAGLVHLIPEIVALTAALADTGEHRVAAVLVSDVADKLHDKDRLADACAAEQADLTALGVRRKQVDDLNTGLEHLRCGADVGEGRRIAVDRQSLFRLDLALAVYRLADDVEHAAQRGLADGHRDGCAGIDGDGAAGDTVRGRERYASDGIVAYLLHDLKRYLAVFTLYLYSVI